MEDTQSPSKLMSGIQILIPRSDSGVLARQLSLSSGTISVAKWEPPNQPYVTPAFVPKPPWRDISVADEHVLIGDRAIDGNWMRIVRIPASILDRFRALKQAASTSNPYDQIVEWMRSRDYNEAVQFVISELESQGAVPQRHRAGVNTNVPGLVTTTTNGKGGRHIGLHVDTFFHRELEKRSSSPGRICINLGQQARFLVFINLPLVMLADRIIRAGKMDPRIKDSGSGLAHLFFETFPDYPVVRIRVAPGEAYIAPTENMVHDGSTDEQSQIDVTLTVLGTFPPDLYTM